MTQDLKIISETPSFTVVQDEAGKFKKIMNYEEFATHIPETDEEKAKMFDVMNNSESEYVVPMKQAIGLELAITNFVISPYESLDETTGEIKKGVTTLIESEDGIWYATSSKSVYYTIQNLTKVFGLPGSENYKPIHVKITSTRQKNGDQINLAVVVAKKK